MQAAGKKSQPPFCSVFAWLLGCLQAGQNTQLTPYKETFDSTRLLCCYIGREI